MDKKLKREDVEPKPKGFVCDKCKVAGWCYRYYCGCGSFCWNCAPAHGHGEVKCGICLKVADWDHADGPCDEVI